MALGRFSVPLKHMCSRKCDMPFIFLFSYLEPASTRIKTVTVGLSAIGAIITLSPFFKVFFENFITIYKYRGYPQNESKSLYLNQIHKLFYANKKLKMPNSP